MIQRDAGLKAVPAAAAIAFALATVITAGLVAVAAGLVDATPEEAATVDTIRAIAEESTTVADNYFAGPEAVAQVLANGIGRDISAASNIDLLRDLTISQPNLDGTYIGFPDGSFVDVRRDSDDTLRIKTIEIAGSDRSVTVDIVDDTGEVLESFPSFDDTYDPRVRPWYEGALDDTHHWTEPYVFFTSQLPGVTHSVAVTDETGQVTAVVGVDIHLENLETFLDARRPSENGGAALFTPAGERIAGQTQVSLNGSEGTPVDEWQVEIDSGDGIVRVPGPEPRVASITRLAIDDDRILVVDAVEAELLGDVRQSRGRLALLSLILGFVALLLMVSSGIAIRRYVQQLDRVARTDSLTGLMNRGALYDELPHLLDSRLSLSVVIIDVDDFKLINDRFGHRVGDEVLEIVADRLVRSAPKEAIVARLGGDEFCIAFCERSDSAETCHSIVHSASGAIVADGRTFDISLSAGYVVQTDEDADISRLLHCADLAMYAAKEESGSCMVQFTTDLEERYVSDRNRRAASREISPTVKAA